MSALILKSKNALDSNLEALDFTLYKSRVLSDGGYIADDQALRDVFNFINTNGINDSMAFSVTSPRWGLKIINGKPNKLYSLFGSNGDIDISVGLATHIDLNTTSDFNTITLRGSSANALLSGKVSNVNNAGICVIAKPLTLGTAAEYGNHVGFALGELAEYGSAVSAAARLAKLMLQTLYARADATKMPVDWYFRALGFAQTGVMNDTITSTTKWASEAVFVNDSGMFMYGDGNLNATDPTVIPPTYRNNLQFSIGRSTLATSAPLAYQNPLLGDVAEAWCLVNTTKEIMQAVSLRASQKYV